MPISIQLLIPVGDIILSDVSVEPIAEIEISIVQWNEDIRDQSGHLWQDPARHSLRLNLDDLRKRKWMKIFDTKNKLQKFEPKARQKSLVLGRKTKKGKLFTDRQIDRQTDRPTNIMGYRLKYIVASSWLKKANMAQSLKEAKRKEKTDMLE